MHRTRIAPTPSGFLHAGNAVSFLITAELARRQQARLRLRIDDLDAERKRPAYVEDIFDSLRWLGIAWDDGPRDAVEQERSHAQLQRVGAYLERVQLLKEQGDLYACTCSRAILARGACACRSAGIPFALHNAAWRLHLPHDAWVRMHEWDGAARLLRPAALMPDPVIRQRAELGGRPAYQIASLSDDIDHGTTFIVRGEDLLPSTACQLYLAERLGLEAFSRIRFVHHPLLRAPDGAKLSKSAGAASLKAMRERGEGPEGLQKAAGAMLNGLLGAHSTP